MTLTRYGGHFEGGTVLPWPTGAEGKGILLAGDTIQVAVDRRHVGFMYGFPNDVPQPAGAVRRVAAAVEPPAFDRIYGSMSDLTIREDASAAISRPRDRHLRSIGEAG